MNRAQTYSHRHAEQVLIEKGLLEEISGLVDQPAIAVAPKATPVIKAAFRKKLSDTGWVLEPLVHQDYKLTINALRSGVGLTIQTGNMARGFYDFLKFQVLYLQEKIDVAVLIVPTISAADTL